MKTKLLLSLLLSFSFYLLSSQVPQGFNYQALAGDASGNPIRNTNLQVKISILSDTVIPVIVWEELHSTVKSNAHGIFSLVVGTGIRQPASVATVFSEINWSATPLFIRTQIYYQNVWKNMGSAKMWTVPYAMVAEKANGVASGSKLAVVSSNDAGTDALFEVKRQDGQTVFAVYPDAVNVYVPRVTAKGSKGGFAIGGFDAVKAAPQDYFRVTPDSVRVYIDPTPTQSKGSKGGFAIGGFGESKGINNMYFNLTGASSVNIVAESPQILWYPIKKAFLAGSIHIGAVDSVGQNSTALGYMSIAMGDFSQAFGYKAKAFGNFSTSIGKNSIAGSKSTPLADNAFAFGNAAKALGNDSYAFGSLAEARGTRAFAFGSVGIDQSGVPTSIPTRASGNYSVALGMGAQASNTGTLALGVNSIASGYSAISLGNGSQATNTNSLSLGNGTQSTGINSTAVGYQSQANGELSIAMGSYYSYSYAALPYFTGTVNTTGDFIVRLSSYTPLTKAITFNRANIANGKFSIAIGNGNLSNNGGLTLGSNNDAIAFGATAIGISNVAKNTNTFAAGYNNLATGFYATAFGNNTYSKSYGSFVIGQYNVITGDSTKWIDTDPLFVVGNGLNNADRSNAVTVYKNGRSIFTGAHANVSLNDKTTRFMYIKGVGFVTSTSVYGLKSYINRADATVSYYYSGYFYDTGTAGIYKGLYADLINADDIYVDFINGTAADVAEYMYDTYANTEAADVVLADPDNKISVIKSAKPYQTSVLGVISTKPMLTMGNELIVNESSGDPLANPKPTSRLALTGRVPVKVCGENGEINPGDYLTTSSTPGHAMKWTLLDVNSAKDFDDLKKILSENEKRRNAIIGKAVERFSGSGTGKIMVLISLQ